MARNKYAYLCTACEHLASRHFLNNDAVTVHGPYTCSHRDCDCVITQSTPTRGIDKRVYDKLFAPTLDEYDIPTKDGE